MPCYYLHSENARQALEAIANGLSCVRLSTDLNLSERDFPLSDQGLVLDEDNRISIDELKRIVRHRGSTSAAMGMWDPVGRP